MVLKYNRYNGYLIFYWLNYFESIFTSSARTCNRHGFLFTIMNYIIPKLWYLFKEFQIVIDTFLVC